MNRFDKVVIVSSYRVLISYLLINKDKLDNILFISDSSLELKSKLLLKNIIEISWPKNFFYLILYKVYYFLYFSTLLCFFCKDKKSLTVYGADHLVGAKFFLKRFPFYVIEDGRANYTSSNYIRSFRNKLFSIPSFGMHKTVKGIYFISEDLDGLPEIIKNRAIFINLKRIWTSKSPAEQSNILLFLKIDINNIKKLLSKKCILFTQPLSEDSIVTEGEKIDIYRDVLSKYNRDVLSKYNLDDLVIKPHPRERTNYEKVFKNVYVFKDNVPSEILDIVGVKFERVITLFSTAAFQYDKDIVDFYGAEVHPKLYKRFGRISFD